MLGRSLDTAARTICALILALAWAGARPAWAQPGAAPDGAEGGLALIDLNDPGALGQFVVLRLDNGDTVRGTLIEVVQGRAVIDHPILGNVVVPLARVARASRGAGAEEPPPAPTPPPAEAEPGPSRQLGDVPVKELSSPPMDDSPAPPEPQPPSADWKTRLELGLDGSQGNSDRLNIRGGLRIERTTERSTARLNSTYVFSTAEGDRTANRLTANLRSDWRIPESKLSWFLQAGAELDEFRSFDVRATGGAGLTSRIIDDEDTRLSWRLGVGVARAFGGPDERLNPELITALEFNHRLTERQRIEVIAEFFPDLEDLGEFRSIVRPAWEFKLDEETNLSLRIGLEHRYETDTTREERSDLDYFATLVLRF
jgi:hypothetical protein